MAWYKILGAAATTFVMGFSGCYKEVNKCDADKKTRTDCQSQLTWTRAVVESNRDKRLEKRLNRWNWCSGNWEQNLDDKRVLGELERESNERERIQNTRREEKRDCEIALHDARRHIAWYGLKNLKKDLQGRDWCKEDIVYSFKQQANSIRSYLDRRTGEYCGEKLTKAKLVSGKLSKILLNSPRFCNGNAVTNLDAVSLLKYFLEESKKRKK